MSDIEKLRKKLAGLEIQLEKVRGKEYELGWQTMRRARVSRKWDMLAQEKMRTLQQIGELENG